MLSSSRRGCFPRTLTVRRLASCVGPAVLALSSLAQSPCTESFESGQLAAWGIEGVAGVTEGILLSPPPDGTHHALVSSSSRDGATGGWEANFPGIVGVGSSLAKVAAALNVPSSLIENLSPETSKLGGALFRDVTATAGELLQFEWDFFTLEAVNEPQYRDYFVLTVDTQPPSAFLLADTTSATLVHLPGSAASHTGLQSSSFVFPATGTFRVGLTVFNVRDDLFGSGALIDLVQLPGSAADFDGDGVSDCLDGCPLDPAKLFAGECGCGQFENAAMLYLDNDGDGFGTTSSGELGCATNPPAGRVLFGGDCNDSAPDVFPGAPEVCNGIDDDCDGIVDDGARSTVVRYCSAKINSAGCSPTVELVGTPSLTELDLAEVLAHDVLNFRSGSMLWGRAPAAKPFQGGLLCIAGPISRTPRQDSGGSTTGQDCSGTFSFQLTANFLTGCGLEPGDELCVQFWSRDPGALPWMSSLTDALRFSICP